MFDPIEEEQTALLRELLQEEISDKALTGFPIVSSRFVDNFGGHRTAELRNIFKTELPQGRRSLRLSLEYLQSVFGSFSEFEAKYPVTIIPATPIFPMFKIVGINTFLDVVYRVFDSRTVVSATGEKVVDYMMSRGKIPLAARPDTPVLRAKPRAVHWCAYEKWATPDLTRDALQILSEWSDCKVRATLPTSAIQDDSYVAYNGNGSGPGFDWYFYEPLTQDQPDLTGGHVQIAVFGEPQVNTVEVWDEVSATWNIVMG